MPASHSLPTPVQAPTLPVKTVHSLPGPSPVQSTRKRNTQPCSSDSDGPVLHVTIVGATFRNNGSHFLTLTSCGSRHRTHVLDGRSEEFDTEEHFTFPLGDTDLDLELSVGATRIGALPPASPCGVMANHDAHSPTNWNEDVGRTTLRLSQLLSCPQPAGSSKVHEMELLSSRKVSQGRRVPVGTVRLRWSMEDRVAEAREAALRAAELHKQKLKAASAVGSAAHKEAPVVYFPSAAKRAREHALGRTRVRVDLEGPRPPTSDSPIKEKERIRAQAESVAFDRAALEAQWKDVLNLYRVVLWLPSGMGPSITLSARQAVGLSDLAAKHPSGKVAFAHNGGRVTLSRGVAKSLRDRLEEKLELRNRPHEMREDAQEAILIIAADGCVSQTQRAVTVGSGEQAKRANEAAGECSSGGSNERHATAEPTVRPRPPHALSATWLDAATLPLTTDNLPIRASPDLRPPSSSESSQASSTQASSNRIVQLGGGASLPRSPAAQEPKPASLTHPPRPLRPVSKPSSPPHPPSMSNITTDDVLRPHPVANGTKAGYSLSDVDITDGAAPCLSTGTGAIATHNMGRPPRRCPSHGALPTIGGTAGSGRPAIGLTSSASIAVLPSAYQRPYGVMAPVAATTNRVHNGLGASRSMAELPAPYTPRGLYGSPSMSSIACASRG